MKIQRYAFLFLLIAYLVLIYFSPASYLSRPPLFLLRIIRLPLEVCQGFAGGAYHIAKSKGYIKENKTLHKTVDILTQQLLRCKEQGDENKRLRALLGFKQMSAFNLIPAEVIGRDAANIYSTLFINKGSRSGIRKDTVAITEAGLVGHVLETSDNISMVMLITDIHSRVSAVAERSRQLGILYGMGTKHCKLKYLPLDADVKVGDDVVTSGVSDVYPKGLTIGRVVKVLKEKDGLTLFAVIRPAVDISVIEELLCIE